MKLQMSWLAGLVLLTTCRPMGVDSVRQHGPVEEESPILAENPTQSRSDLDGAPDH